MARIGGPWRGLMLWESRQKPDNLDATYSSYTEGATAPGVVTYVADQLLAPIVSGGQASSVDVKVVDAGPARIAGCGVQWRIDGESEWTGYSEPDVLMHFSYIDYTTTETLDRADATVIEASQTPVVVYAEDGTAGTYCRTYSHAAAQWSSEYTISAATPQNGCAVVALESGRLLAVVYSDTGGGDLFYSDDDGATWADYATGTSGVLSPMPTGYGGDSMSMARVGADLVCFITDGSGGLAQVASETLGTTWVEVADVASTGYSVSTTPLSNGRVAVCYRRSSDSYPVMRILSSAFQPFSDAEEIVINAAAISVQVVTIGDHNGGIYAYVRDSEVIKAYRSSDDGDTWASMGQVVDFNDANTFPTPVCGLWFYGSAMLICNQAADPATNDGSLASYRFGGWEDYQHGEPWDWQYLPIDLPENTGTAVWAAGGTGGSASLAAGGLTVTTSADTKTYTNTTTASNYLQAVFDVRCTAGGSGATPPTDTSPHSGVRIQWDDGTNQAQFSICFTTTGYTVYDNYGSTLRTQQTIDMTNRVQIYVALAATTSVTVRHKRPWERTWTDVGQLALNTNVATGQFIRFGNIFTATATSKWHGIFIREDVSTGPQTQTQGKAIGSLGNYVPDVGTSDHEALLSLSAGPGVEGETYDIDVDHEYPIEACHPVTSPSPSKRWRSSSAAEQIIAWDIGEGMQTQLGKAIGLYVDGGAPRQIELEWLDESGAPTWTSGGTMDLATGFTGLTYDREGDVVIPDGATASAGRYLQENELAGGYIEDTANNWARRIRANTSGYWDATAGHTPVIYLEDVDDGSDPATGTCQLVAPRGVYVRHLAGSVYRARYWRVKITAQDVPESYVRAGTIMLGRVVPFGADPSWDWSDDYEPNVERTTDRYGTTRARQLGPMRGRWVWAWSDPLTLLDIRGVTSDIDYIARAGGQGLATAESVWTQLRGVMSKMEGGAHPVVGLRAIPTAVSSTVTDPTLFLYGELVSGVGWRSVRGEEDVDEWGRLEGATIEGIV